VEWEGKRALERQWKSANVQRWKGLTLFISKPNWQIYFSSMNQAESKLAKISVWFWIIKITATTLGETFSDYLAHPEGLQLGYAVTAGIVIAFFLITLLLQLRAERHHPVLFWLVILSTSVAGTSISDFIDRTLHTGYTAGSLILALLLIIVFWLWKSRGGQLSVSSIQTRRDEMYYWIAILISNTLGTALGDFLADNSGLGFAGGAELIGAILLVVSLLYFFTSVSQVLLFWLAFILTRPFGATLGDTLTKSHEQGGLALGTASSSLVLVTIMTAAIVISNRVKNSETFSSRL
jgi:uncharacterized membrane-anchored protein